MTMAAAATCRVCRGIGSFVLQSHRWDASAGRMVAVINGPFRCRACSPAKAQTQAAILRLRDDQANDARIYR